MPASVEPLPNCFFRVEIEGIVEGSFNEVIIDDAKTQVIEYREGGDLRVRKLPGLTKFSSVTLRRAVTGGDELYNWWRATSQGTTDRKAMSVMVLDKSLAEVMRWNFFECWPARYGLSKLDAQGNDVFMETVEVTFELMERA